MPGTKRRSLPTTTRPTRQGSTVASPPHVIRKRVAGSTVPWNSPDDGSRERSCSLGAVCRASARFRFGRIAARTGRRAMAATSARAPPRRGPIAGRLRGPRWDPGRAICPCPYADVSRRTSPRCLVATASTTSPGTTTPTRSSRTWETATAKTRPHVRARNRIIRARSPVLAEILEHANVEEEGNGCAPRVRGSSRRSPESRMARRFGIFECQLSYGRRYANEKRS